MAIDMRKGSLTGTWFRQARLKLDLSIAEVAVAMDLHVNTIENWERGTIAPPAYAADLIARVLKQPLPIVALEIAKLAIAIRQRKKAA
jgi:DNA-binding transcriptional regulator YiaG